jgi:phage terminase large subunit
MAEVESQIHLPPKLVPLFAPPRGTLRYRASKGGRGSAKSMTFAKMAAVFGYMEPLRILCTRDLLESIKESFYAEIKAAIESEPWLAWFYDVGESYIRGRNGTEFIFKGLRYNIKDIKSMAQIDICIIEEADSVSEKSWLDLEPTIRAPKSEIWVIWNPEVEGSPVDKRLCGPELPPRAMVVEMNYRDNPWFPAVLEEQRITQKRLLDPDTYAWIWDGAYLKQSKSSVFYGKWVVEAFTPADDWDGPYYGLDFGFSNDPTAGVKMWVYDETLYYEYECGGVGIETNQICEILRTGKFTQDDGTELHEDSWGVGLPGVENYEIRCDNARPETISAMQKQKTNGLPLAVACDKGKGSVEDGIAHMKSFKRIVIHPRCQMVETEMKKYSYKVDRLTGQVTTILVDKDNHYIDASRYGLEPVMSARWSFFS